MKKTIFTLWMVGIAVASVVGCSKQEGRMEFIGSESAKQIAFTDSNLKESQVLSVDVDLENRKGQSYYQVEFSTDEGAYQYNIDALTGVIIEADQPTKTNGAAQKDEPNEAGGAEQPGQSEAEWQPDEEDAAEQPGQPGKEWQPDEEDAAEQPDQGDGAELQPGLKRNSGKKLTKKAVIELVLSQVPGATESDIREIEIDREDGRLEYEGEIVFDGIEYEFAVDAYSGAFRKWEAEYVHHGDDEGWHHDSDEGWHH